MENLTPTEKHGMQFACLLSLLLAIALAIVAIAALITFPILRTALLAFGVILIALVFLSER